MGRMRVKAGVGVKTAQTMTLRLGMAEASALMPMPLRCLTNCVRVRGGVRVLKGVVALGWLRVREGG